MALPEVELAPLPTRTSAITQEATIGVQAMIRPQVPVHMGQTLGVLQRGAADAAYRITAREPGAETVWVTARTPQLMLPVTLRFSRAADNTPEPALPALHRLLMRPILVRAWARLSPEMLLEEPQARADVEALVRSCPAWLGLGDSWESFTASAGYASLPRSLRRAHQEHPGLRLSASDQLDRHVFAAIIEQRVTLKEAFQTQRDVLIRYGEPAVESGYRDQPAGMRVHPTARTLGAIPDWGRLRPRRRLSAPSCRCGSGGSFCFRLGVAARGGSVDRNPGASDSGGPPGCGECRRLPFGAPCGVCPAWEAG